MIQRLTGVTWPSTVTFTLVVPTWVTSTFLSSATWIPGCSVGFGLWIRNFLLVRGVLHPELMKKSSNSGDDESLAQATKPNSAATSGGT